MHREESTIHSRSYTRCSTEGNSPYCMAEELVYSGRIEGAMGGGGFDELRECAICHENYDQSSRVPRILECTHTLCEACLLNLIQVTLQEEQIAGGGH